MPNPLSSPADQAILEQIAAAVKSKLSDWFGQGACLSAGDPIISFHDWSVMLKYDGVDGNGKPFGLMIKISRPARKNNLVDIINSPANEEDSFSEFQILQAVAAVFGENDTHLFSSIKPLAYFKSWRAIVMEEKQPHPAPVKSLLSPRLFLHPTGEWRAFEAVLFRTGQWLKTFHQVVGEKEWAVTNLADVQQQILAPLARLEKAAGPQNNVAAIKTALHAALTSIPCKVLPISLCHGDLNCTNVQLCQDGRLLVLDYNDSKTGPMYQDLAHFIVDLATYKYQLISQGLFISYKQLQRCIDSLLQGYSDSLPIDRNLINIFCALAVLDKWAYIEERFANTKRRKRLLIQYCYLPVVRRMYRSIFFNFLSGLDQAYV